MGTMNRRDFLTLRTEGGKRIVDLSCERLYMRYVDARSGVGRVEPPLDDGDPGAWVAEPPALIETPPPRALFAALEGELADADELRVLDRAWLTGEEFGSEVLARLEAFERRGGHVEWNERSTPA